MQILPLWSMAKAEVHQADRGYSDALALALTLAQALTLALTLALALALILALALALTLSRFRNFGFGVFIRGSQSVPEHFHAGCTFRKIVRFRVARREYSCSQPPRMFGDFVIRRSCGG